MAHHLREEEQRFFQMAGKLLSDAQKAALARDDLKEYNSARAELSVMPEDCPVVG